MSENNSNQNGNEEQKSLNSENQQMQIEQKNDLDNNSMGSIFAERTIKDESEKDIHDQNIQNADGITTPEDGFKKNPPLEETFETVQGEIPQDMAIKAIQENRKLRKEVAQLKARYES
jgi:hypothetical protein